MDNQKPQTVSDRGTQDQGALLAFVDELIRLKNEQLNEEQLKAKQVELLDATNEAINLHLINLLTEENQKKLEALMNQNASPEDIAKVFSDNIPEMEKEITAALVEFRQMYLEGKLDPTNNS